MTDLAPHALANHPLDRARRHIEANLFEPLTLADLAAAAGVSPYHFTRQFGARFGLSPMAYVRIRRLQNAAARLAGDPPPTLIDLAFDCGFDSQEGFTRAFKRAFGMPPGAYRRAGAPSLEMEFPIMAVANLTASPEPVRKPGLRIAGLSKVFDADNKAGIPDLWAALFAATPGGLAGKATLGVCAAAPGREPGSMRYTAGFGLEGGAPAPDGLELIELAPQAYLVFRQILDGSDLHTQMQAAAKQIWGDLLPKSGRKLAPAPDLEVYPVDFAPDRPGLAVEWWVPVEA